MKLGISGQALGPVMSFRDIVALGKQLDIYDYEIWPVNAPGEGEDYAHRDVKEIARIQNGEGIQVHCVTLGAAFNPYSWASAQDYEKLMRSAVDAAAELGAGIVNHYCYHLNMASEHDFRHLEACWRRPLEHAKAVHVRLALENEAHDGTRTPEMMRAILDYFDDPFFLTNFDATNYLHASCEAFPAAYDILKDKIGYVHLKNGCLFRPGAGQRADCRGAAMSGHYNPLPIQYALLSDGAVNIAGLLNRLKEDGVYDGLCTFEPHAHTPEAVKEFYEKDTRWLRSLGFFSNK